MRPLTYGEPRRFDTIPSQPSLQAWRYVTAVIEVLDEPQPGPQERRRLASVALRLS